ncbi:MAG TPA: CocE/NonD family hydrolase [Firmicutes bacterium]|nr:CocE/NonD family hydrolase [Candidatus Fermentithermobacillaceae bacterium]
MRSFTFEVPMKDGVRLATSVLSPDSGGPWPVIVARTPYSRKGLISVLAPLCDYGYAVVAQDTRGTGDSEGTLDLIRQEPQDAVAAAGWILAQPFCNGSIGILGLSYLGAASISMASHYKENVKACVWVSPVIGEKHLFLEGGALRLHHNLPWMALGNPEWRNVDWKKTYRHLPLEDALDVSGVPNPTWRQICRNWDEWWAGRDLSDYYCKAEVPGLHFAGFWDFMADSALRAYELMSRSGSPQVMVMGPWSHNGIAGEVTKNAHADYGPEASPRFMERTLTWFNHWMKGEPLPEDLRAPVSAFIPGAGWVQAQSWPPAASAEAVFYLGGGFLTDSPPERGEAYFEYDPANPVPTEGGAVWEFPRAGLDPGPAVVTTGNRPDVLLFRSRPLDKPLRCLGPASVVLFVQSSAPSTDFTAKIVDEDPEGEGRIVADTIFRWTRDIGPEITLHFPVVGHVFRQGHRIRLDISSSNFPRFDRNLNTGKSGLVSAETAVASQTLLFGGSTPSRLVLTVI